MGGQEAVRGRVVGARACRRPCRWRSGRSRRRSASCCSALRLVVTLLPDIAEPVVGRRSQRGTSWVRRAGGPEFWTPVGTAKRVLREVAEPLVCASSSWLRRPGRRLRAGGCVLPRQGRCGGLLRAGASSEPDGGGGTVRAPRSCVLSLNEGLVAARASSAGDLATAVLR